MPLTPGILLLLAALLCFVCAAFNARTTINLTALGLAFATAAALLRLWFVP